MLKGKICAWLEENKISYKEDFLKVELVDILRKSAPEPTYEIDSIVKRYGHHVMRTPPYHPELQPIEKCWAVVKNEVARNCDFTMDNLLIKLENAFEKVTAETCKKIIKRIRLVENKFWEEDAELDRK